MKYAFIVPDGAADRRVEALGGKTPLEHARTPHMDRLAREGRLGLARTIPVGMKPGSDVGHLALLGYDPRRYLTGRAPIEAAAMRIAMGPQTVAFRMNLVTTADGNMLDYSAGHVTTEDARALVASISTALHAKDLGFHVGVEYRHIMTWEGWPAGAPEPETTPPHDITGKPLAPHMPRGPGADRLASLMERSKLVLGAHPVNKRRVAEGHAPATQIWLWGSGRAPKVPRIAERYQVRGAPQGGGAEEARPLTGAAISPVDIVRGLAVLAGLDIAEAPGQTAYYDTDYAATGRAAALALDSHDLVYVHVEAPDEATHEGLTEKKVEAIERIDADIVGPLLAALEARGEPFRVLVSPDHATTLESRTHVADPVPFALFGAGVERRGGSGYNEPAAAEAQGAEEPVEGHELLARLVRPT
jgi:2,3-bisphosphoglycerate-independent phosphoglycerate mutase